MLISRQSALSVHARKARRPGSTAATTYAVSMKLDLLLLHHARRNLGSTRVRPRPWRSDWESNVHTCHLKARERFNTAEFFTLRPGSWHSSGNGRSHRKRMRLP
eukprot:scaffold152525_cov33-Tisochrysis_lutea.AAC.1